MLILEKNNIISQWYEYLAIFILNFKCPLVGIITLYNQTRDNLQCPIDINTLFTVVLVTKGCMVNNNILDKTNMNFAISLVRFRSYNIIFNI